MSSPKKQSKIEKRKRKEEGDERLDENKKVENMITKACAFLDKNGVSTKTPKKKGKERLNELVLRIKREKGLLTNKEWFETSVSTQALNAFREWESRQTSPQKALDEYRYWRRVEQVVPSASQVRERCPPLPKNLAEARDRFMKRLRELRASKDNRYNPVYS